MPALVVLLVGLLLAPAIARLQRSSGEAHCQSNMHQWAQAMALYLDDNQHFYPTNRTLPSAGGMLISRADLTPLNTDGSSKSDPEDPNQPLRFGVSFNWVEALYPYIWINARKTGQDWKSFRTCPNAPDRTDPYTPTSGSIHPRVRSAAMTYAFNCYLVEQPKGIARNASNLMMLREMDRKVNSYLRPSNVTNRTVSNTSPPTSTFLTAQFDKYLESWLLGGPPNPNQHGSGSYILFADGHVKWFGTNYMPTGDTSCRLYAADSWDANDSCWYNYNGTTTTVPANLRKTIAVTP